MLIHKSLFTFLSDFGFLDRLYLASFIFHQVSFLDPHSSTLVVKHFVLAFAKLSCLIIHKKLLSDRSLLILFLDSVPNTTYSTTCYDCSNLKELGQVVGVVVFVKSFGENLVSKFDGFQVVSQFFG